MSVISIGLLVRVNKGKKCSFFSKVYILHCSCSLLKWLTTVLTNQHVVHKTFWRFILKIPMFRTKESSLSLVFKLTFKIRGVLSNLVHFALFWNRWFFFWINISPGWFFSSWCSFCKVVQITHTLPRRSLWHYFAHASWNINLLCSHMSRQVQTCFRTVAPIDPGIKICRCFNWAISPGFHDDWWLWYSFWDLFWHFIDFNCSFTPVVTLICAAACVDWDVLA